MGRARQAAVCGSCVAAVVAALAVAFYYLQDGVVYHPAPLGYAQRPNDNPQGTRSPKEYNMRYADIAITTEDDVVLRGWLMTQSDPLSVPTLLFFHENALNLGYRLSYFSALYLQLRVNVIAVSYRGFGDSEGSPSERGVQLDGKAILRYATETAPVDRENVYVLGRSLGGAVAIYSLAEGTRSTVQVKGLVLENTFTSIDDMADIVMPVISPIKDWVLTNHWRSVDLIPSIVVPILFISGLDDELVPPRQMKALWKAATAAKFTEFVSTSQIPVPGGTHNGTWKQMGVAYFQTIQEFMDKASKGSE